MENEKWGYMNQRGETVIPPQFDRALDFFENKAAVVLHGKAGYIDESGGWKIEPRWDAARSFRDGAAIVAMARMQSRVIDSTGTVVTQREFTVIEDFSEGLAAVWQDAVEAPFGGTSVIWGGKWGFADNKGVTVIGPRFDRVKRFTEGLAAINVDVRFDKGGVTVDGGKWGFIDTIGQIVIPPQFDEVKPFYSGVAVFWDRDLALSGLIDRSGSVVLEATYTLIGGYSDHNPFHDGLALAERRDRRHDFLRPSGKVAFKCPGSSCQQFSQGLAAFRDGSLTGYINTQGAVAIPPAFAEAMEFSEDLAAVKHGVQWGYIDRRGKWIIPPQFESAMPFVDGLALAKTGSRWSYINPTGQVVRDNVWDGRH
jgi:hypothetical protein